MSPSFARSLNDTVHSNASAYTLATVRDDDDDGDGDTAPLLSPLTPREPSYGTAPLSPAVHNNSRRIIFNAALKMGVIFLVSSLFLGGTLWLALPTLDECAPVSLFPLPLADPRVHPGMIGPSSVSQSRSLSCKISTSFSRSTATSTRTASLCAM